MPESFIQVPPDSTGKKSRTRSRVIGANTVQETAVFQAALPTYYALADTVAFANGKSHISLFNDAGSGVVVAIKKLFPINLQISAVTGTTLRMDIRRTTSTVHSAGTLITPASCDTSNPALPAGVTVRTGATVTDSTLLYPLMIQTDEIAAANTGVSNILTAVSNWQPEGAEIQETRLRPGQGYNVRQNTNGTIGSYAWLIVFTLDDE